MRELLGILVWFGMLGSVEEVGGRLERLELAVGVCNCTQGLAGYWV